MILNRGFASISGSHSQRNKELVMAGDENQRNVFEFLTDHLESQEPFTTAQLEAVTTWRGKTFQTYWSKQYEQFVIPALLGSYRVSESFRPFTIWEKFQQHVTQVRRISSDYKRSSYLNLTFEFFMPLSNEAHLRTTLDNLFYKDAILAKLKTQDETELFSNYSKLPNETSEAYLDRLCNWIANRFVGYSISHVSGRFRAGQLSTREEVANLRTRYLVDETTAVTRFIFPCQGPEEAKQIRWFFECLFVNSIIQLVNGEAEIWMIESGLESRVYVWRVDQ
jgi:hypothetical protein